MSVSPRALPVLPPDCTSFEQYADARRQNWVAQSSRGLEVLRHRQGWAVLEHPKLEKGPAFRRRLDEIGITCGAIREFWERMVICNEGDVRTRLRVPLGQLFRPVQMAKLQSHVRSMIDETLDAIEDPTDVDFMSAFAWKLPPLVYCHLVSAPKELAPWVMHTSDTILSPILTADRSRKEASIQASWEAKAFIERHIEQRRGNLGDDFTSIMIRQQMEGLLSQEELIIQAMSILQASMDNTVHQLGLTFGVLLEEPSRWQRIVAEPALIPAAIEETLRLRPRFGTIFRYARQAVEFEDIVIPRDSWVFVAVRSANRDAEKFEAADEFRFGRPAGRAMMFGSGPYNCLGQTLARLEITETIRAFIRRFPNMRMLGDWQRHDTNAVTETAHLRVSLV